MAKAKPAKPYKIEINEQCVPDDPNLGLTNGGVKTVDPDRVGNAYYPFPNQEHGHHLQGADDDIDMAIWSFGDQGRVLQQEERNHDETIVPSKKR